MVTTTTSYSDARYRASTGQGLDGVVRVSSAGYYGTGVLLFDGQAVLTAAHLFARSVDKTASVSFETTAGLQTISSSKVLVDPIYDPVNGNNDLALVWLSSVAPAKAERYNLYRASDELGQVFTFSGYGTVGTGDSGALSGSNASAQRYKAQNVFDADVGNLRASVGLSWIPVSGSQLVADFDNGKVSNDALGLLMGKDGFGMGLNEGLIAPGDSGGPAFLKGAVAGIASYTASLNVGSNHPDVDNVANSSFGEIAAWQRVSYYQQWIDQALRAQYTQAPTKPSEVQTSVKEGASGTITLAFFLVQFIGTRSSDTAVISVDYATRDGTATAGVDYLATSGTLKLYPSENQAVIPIEILGDNTMEPNETFFMDVTNPVGASFIGQVTKLSAMRTIINDDFISA